MGDAVSVGYAEESLVGVGMNAGDGEVPEASAPTILDLLNEDCWRALLKYLRFKDMVRSERVSRRWQGLVHRYLRDVGLCFMSHHDEFMHVDQYRHPRMLKVHPKNRIYLSWLETRYPGDKKLEAFLHKWGPYIVHYHCAGNQALEKTARDCPNLKSLSIKVPYREPGPLSQQMVEYLEKLERIAFVSYTAVDRSLGEVADEEYRKMLFGYRESDNDYHEEPTTDEQKSEDAAFWSNFRPTNLKSLTMRGIFDFRHVLSGVECYPNLKELILQGEFKNAHLLLQKMPKLERLHLVECWTDNVWTEHIPEHVCNGLQLKQFVVWHSPIENGWSKDVLTRCRGLQSLSIGCIDNTNMFFYHSAAVMPVEISPFLKELCQAHGPTLTGIKLFQITLSDDELVTLIRFCPKLTNLDIRICFGLSDAFLKKIAIAAQRWRRRLHVYIGGYDEDYLYKITQASHPEVLVQIEPPEHYGGRRYEVQTSYPGLLVEIENPYNGSRNGYEELMIPQQYIWHPMFK